MDNAAFEKPPPYAEQGENHPPPPPYNVSNQSQPMVNPAGPTTTSAPHSGLQYPNVYPPPGYGYQQNYGTTVTVQPNYGRTVMVQPTDIIIVGGCPVCRVGILETDFTCLGILCAIFFFPLGVLFCLAMRQHRCANCGALFG